MAVLKYPVPAAELRAAVLQALERCESRGGEPTSPTGAGTPAAGTAPSPPAPAGPPPGPVAAGVPHLAPTVKGAPAMPLPMVGAAPTIALHAPGGAPRLGPASESIPTVAGMVGPSGGMLAVHAPAPTPAAPRLDLMVRELGLIGNDPSWRQVVELAATIAAARSPVLIAGEPGTGKTQLARLIHAMGPGTDRPFIRCEAAALADELAPDDADRPEGAPLAPADSALIWAARLNLARGGSLYIDDVADLPVALQLLLLRDLQVRDYASVSGYPAGGDVRFVLSSCESLPALIEQGRFRQELYHRVSVVVLTPPPLRHRGTDIELLAEAFRDRYAQEFHKNVGGFTRDALDILQRHDWPGNVRELEAAIQRAVAMCNGPRISSNHLAPILNHHRQARGAAGTPRPHLPMGIRPLKEALEEPEKRIIIQALQAFNWNRQETARVLDINRTTLYKKMKKYGLLIDEPMWAQ
jgi:two-component system response regulator HydG